MAEDEEVRIERCKSALLTWHDFTLRSGQSSAARLSARLGGLSWMLTPVVIGQALARTIRSSKGMLGEERVENLCATLSNADPERVEDCLPAILGQLMILDSRTELPWRETASLPSLKPSQLEAAAEALIRFYFTSDGARDPWLQATQDAATDLIAASGDFLQLPSHERRRRFRGATTSYPIESELARSRDQTRFFDSWLQWAVRAGPTIEGKHERGEDER